MSRTLTAFALLTLLTGCQALSYQPPSGEDTASITFTSDNIAVQPVVCVPGTGFRATREALAHMPFESEFFSELNANLKKSKEVTVDVSTNSGQVVVGFVMQRRQDNGPRDRCKVAVRLPVGSGDHHRVHFSLENGHCGVRAQDMNGAPVTDALPVPWQCD